MIRAEADRLEAGGLYPVGGKSKSCDPGLQVAQTVIALFGTQLTQDGVRAYAPSWHGTIRRAGATYYFRFYINILHECHFRHCEKLYFCSRLTRKTSRLCFLPCAAYRTPSGSTAFCPMVRAPDATPTPEDLTHFKRILSILLERNCTVACYDSAKRILAETRAYRKDCSCSNI